MAGIRSLQTAELERQGIVTLEQLAEEPKPLREKPLRGSEATFTAVQAQARVQLEARRRKTNVYELIDPEPQRGLARLPEPAAGDVFFDIEGDHFVADGGLEYLLGYAFVGSTGDLVYERIWARVRWGRI